MRRGGYVDRTPGDGARERRLEEALRESEERFRRLVEAAKDYAIFMTDAEGRVSTWNEGAARLFGYGEGEIVGADRPGLLVPEERVRGGRGRGEMLGEDGSVLFVPEDRESGAPEREHEKARTEGRAEDERWHLRKDGTRFWASGFVRPILDEEGDLIGYSKVARDLTERRRAAEGGAEARRAAGGGPA